MADGSPVVMRRPFMSAGLRRCDQPHGLQRQALSVMTCIRAAHAALNISLVEEQIEVVDDSNWDFNPRVPGELELRRQIPVLPELPPLVQYGTSINSVASFHVISAEQLGLGLQMEFQPLMQGGMYSGGSMGSHYGFLDWRYCALFCARRRSCRAWTFKFLKSRLPIQNPFNATSPSPMVGELGRLGSCHLKTAMSSATSILESDSLVISGTRSFAVMQIEMLPEDHLLVRYFGDFAMEVASVNRSNFDLHMNLECRGCLRAGQMFVSPDYDTGAVIRQRYTHLGLEKCLKACKLDEECIGIQYIGQATYVPRLIPHGVTCMTFSKLTQQPSDLWAFAIVVRRLKNCEMLGGTTNQIAIANSSLLHQWGSPFESDKRLYGVGIRGELISAAEGPRIGDSTVGSNVIIDCSSVEMCNKLCDNTPVCEGYTYNSRTNVCALLRDLWDFRRDSVGFTVSGLKNKTAPLMSSVIGSYSNTLPSDHGEIRLYVTCSSVAWNSPWLPYFDGNSVQFDSYLAQNCFEHCSVDNNCIQWLYDPYKFVCHLLTKAPKYYPLPAYAAGHYVGALSFCDVSGQPRVGTMSFRFPLVAIVLGTVGVAILLGILCTSLYMFSRRKKYRA